MEGLDRLRAEHPAGRRHDVPVELRRRRGCRPARAPSTPTTSSGGCWPSARWPRCSDGERRQGAHVEVAQVETLINVLGDLFLADALDPGSVRPLGNRDERGAPWGVYQCAGEERWCVITVRDDDDWQRLRKALGDPEWAQASELDTVDGRRRRHDELDAHLAEWTATRTDVEVMETLQARRRAGRPDGLPVRPRRERALRRPPLPAPGRAAADRRAAAGGRRRSRPTVIPEPLVTAAPHARRAHARDLPARSSAMTDDEIDALVAEGALEEAPEQRDRAP